MVVQKKIWQKNHQNAYIHQMQEEPDDLKLFRHTRQLPVIGWYYKQFESATVHQ